LAEFMSKRGRQCASDCSAIEMQDFEQTLA
jgi:hypothetical protein